MRALPYQDYSWPLTQHAAGFNKEAIHGMLSCALPFEGEANAGRSITNLMVAAGLLTTNVRDGVADAWRDYQQLLAELGLIYSTRICPNIQLTDLAKSFVGGEVEYPSMMAMQSFRYQYPNGQKFTLQATQRTSLSGSRFAKIENQIKLHVAAGVMIRPAVLILRVLYELHTRYDERPLTLSEIRNFLLPSRTNSEWPQCVQEVVQSRASGGLNSREPVDRTRRNLQDWLKLLRENPFFNTDGRSFIGLSSLSIDNPDRVLSIISSGEDIGSFWIPLDHSVEEQIKWFSWYGRFGDIISYIEEAEYQQTNQEEIDIDYQEEDEESIPATMPVSLSEIDEEALLNKKGVSIGVDDYRIVNSVISGAMKRYAKHILHDEIVAEFSRKFKAQGARVESDPNTVDLLVSWEDKSALFEVKTVSYKNIQSRLRLALGQVEEYSFRLSKEKGLSPDRCIIINRKLPNNSWQAEFLADHMKVGLISRTSSGIDLIPPREATSCSYWV